jgi:hypothetical protein
MSVRDRDVAVGSLCGLAIILMVAGQLGHFPFVIYLLTVFGSAGIPSPFAISRVDNLPMIVASCMAAAIVLSALVEIKFRRVWEFFGQTPWRPVRHARDANDNFPSEPTPKLSRGN